jgi:integrase
MSSLGVIVKRCGCVQPGTRRRRGGECPRLAERGHGSWYFHCSVTTMFGGHERVRRGGYPSRRAAETARDELLEQSRAERTTQTWTTARWLRHWLTTKTGIRPSTLRSYTEHVNRHLIPHLGRIRLGELTGHHVAAMFATITATPTRYGRSVSPSTLHRIRATLRSALNAAIRDGLIRDNPARHVELPTPRQPQAQVWTDPRVAAWRRTGQRYPVAVWTARQLAEFLDHVRGDRLFAMWWLVALRGLRRGEAAGLRWTDLDLDHKVIMVAQQRIAYGHTVEDSEPKTKASRRTIALDRTTVALLRAHLKRQHTERLAAAGAWHDSGKVFTNPDGSALHPDWVTRRFARGWSPTPAYRRYGCTTCATARPAWPTPPAPTSRPCKNSSGTPASCSPPTPTPASCSTSTSGPPRPPPGSCSKPPPATLAIATAPRSAHRSPQQPTHPHGHNQ